MHGLGKHSRYLLVIFVFIFHFCWEMGGDAWWSGEVDGTGSLQVMEHPTGSTGEGIRSPPQTLPLYKLNYRESGRVHGKGQKGGKITRDRRSRLKTGV